MLPAGPVGPWLAAFLVTLALALLLGNAPLLALSALLLALGLAGAWLCPPDGVSVRRRVARPALWVGDAFEVERLVTVERGAGLLFFYDLLPNELSLERGSNYRVLWKWPGRREYDLSYSLRCVKRGGYTLPPTRWEGELPAFPGGRRQGESGDALRILAAPQLTGVRRLAQARARAVTPFPNADLARLGVATTDFLELRPYSPGDPIRSINWKATARLPSSASPLVNQYEKEGRRAVWLFVDGASYMEVGTSLATPLEQAVEAANALARYYLQQGYTLGACVFHSAGGLLTPDVGEKQFRRLSQKLLNLRGERNAESLATAAARCGRYLTSLVPQVIVVTRLDALPNATDGGGETWETFLAAVKRLSQQRPRARRRAPVWVVNVGGAPYLNTGAPPASQAAQLLRWETLPRLRQLRQAGISVLDWQPNEEPFALVLWRQLQTSGHQRF